MPCGWPLAKDRMVKSENQVRCPQWGQSDGCFILQRACEQDGVGLLPDNAWLLPLPHLISLPNSLGFSGSAFLTHTVVLVSGSSGEHARRQLPVVCQHNETRNPFPLNLLRKQLITAP